MTPHLGQIVAFKLTATQDRAAIVTRVAASTVDLNVQLVHNDVQILGEEASGRTAVLRAHVIQGSGIGQWGPL